MPFFFRISAQRQTVPEGSPIPMRRDLTEHSDSDPAVAENFSLDNSST